MQVAELNSLTATQRFYETRYAQGYMDTCGGDRQSRLREVLASIELPDGARVLDFGCGSGALTDLLAEFWPNAEVHGIDISETAIRNARERVPGARFHVMSKCFVEDHAGEFDLVFSHHVLEHVFDLRATVEDIASLTASQGRMLHVLPCGNAGSLAHWLCRQRSDGIDGAHGNRFFFEEASHLRRLCTRDLETALAPFGCQLHHAAYGYHWFGVLRLMTEMTPPQWFAMIHPLRCYVGSLVRLLPLLMLVATIAGLRAPTQILLRSRRVWRQVTQFRTRRLGQASTQLLFLLAIPSLLLAPLSIPVEAWMRAADRREWRRRRSDPRGSEMFLQFERSDVSTQSGSRVPKRAMASIVADEASIELGTTAIIDVQ